MALKRITVLALFGSLAAAGCGGAHSTSAASHPAAAASRGAQPATAASRSARPATAASPRAGNPPGFAWLHPVPAPAGWSTARLLGATVLAYPSSWHRIHSDPGTVSAAVVEPRTGIVMEYLNATPRQGAETLQNWRRFRPDHNLDEGDRHEQVLASATGLRFRNGTGSCVMDRYRTSRTSYQEIACLVQGSHEQSVIVATALSARWAQAAPALERAVSAFLA
jgi:hypothetical protein